MKMKIKVKNRSGMSFKKIEKKIDKQFLKKNRYMYDMEDVLGNFGSIFFGLFFSVLGFSILFVPKNDGNDFIINIMFELFLFALFGIGGMGLFITRIIELFMIKRYRETIKYCGIIEKLEELKRYQERSIYNHNEPFYSVKVNGDWISPIAAYEMLSIAKAGKIRLKWDHKTGNVAMSYKDPYGRKHVYKSLTSVPYKKTGKKPTATYYGNNLLINMYGEVDKSYKTSIACDSLTV